MKLCDCPTEGDSRIVNLQIGDGGRVFVVCCPDCEALVIPPDQLPMLHADQLTVTMTRCVEPPMADGEPDYVWYQFTDAPPEVLAEAERGRWEGVAFGGTSL